MLLMLAGGCSAAPQQVGPGAQAQESALATVWESAYGMEVASRPTSIEWWAADGCHEELSITGQSLVGSCALDSEGSKGDIYVRWEGSIAASNFSRALVMWRQYLLTGAMTRPSPVDIELVNSANDMLLAQHL